MDNTISIIIPCLNEEGNIAPLITGIIKETKNLEEKLEIILIDDGSKDGTWKRIIEVAEENKSILGLRLSRNFGQQAAILAGLNKSSGSKIIVMDCDLQDPPSLIPRLVEKSKEGFDIVHAKRLTRSGEPCFKKLTAWLYYRIANSICETPWELDSGEYKLISRRVSDTICNMEEQGRIMRALVSWTGFKQGVIEYARPPRHSGYTKFPISKMLRLAWTGLMSFSTIPLRIISLSGITLLLIGLIYGLYSTTKWLVYGIGLTPWSLIILINIGIGGLILLGLGIIGEYISQIYIEVKKRPHYIIEEEFNQNEQ